jgi:hypothetical protein
VRTLAVEELLSTLRAGGSPEAIVCAASAAGWTLRGTGRLRAEGGPAPHIFVGHIDCLDGAWYREIARRAAAVCARTGISLHSPPPDGRPSWWGVKPAGGSGASSAPARRWTARMFNINTLRHLGTFSSVVEAAVA